MQAKRVTFQRTALPLALLAPQLAVTGIFFLWPAYQAMRQSLYQEDAFGLKVVFSGLANFRDLMVDPTYLASLIKTLEFSLSVAVVSLSLGLLLAVLADGVGRGSKFYQLFLVWPYAVAPAVSGVLWVYMFDPSIGPITKLLRGVGIDWNHQIHSGQAFALIVMASCAKQIAYNFLFFLAGLQSIPKSLLEAAALDAAGPIRRFFTIQFPLLTPTSFFLLVVNMVYAFFETFGVIDATTYGGPGQSTNILVYRVFNDGFKNQRIGASAAESVVLLAIVAVFTFIQFRFVERKVEY